jgi:hypothetical protein
MAMEGSSSARAAEGAGGATRPPGTLRAIQVLLRVLAVLVFAQPVFAGLLLDGNESWREWHSMNGMTVIPLLTLALIVLATMAWRAGHAPGWMPLVGVAMFLVLVVQNIMGNTSVLAVHVPLGVAILGGIGTLIARVRALPVAATGRREG